MSESSLRNELQPKVPDVNSLPADAGTFADDFPTKQPVWKPKSPELRRRKYSLASVMRILEKKSDETKESKEETRERKLQKRELNQNSKQVKRKIFNLRSKQNNASNNNNKTTEECVENGVYLIPPVPCELGYNDLLIEEVGKPRSSCIIHASDNALLSDVQRQRSPRISRSPRMKLAQSNSLPPSPSSDGRPNSTSTGRLRRAFKSDSGYEDNGERSPVDTSYSSDTFNLTNSDLRTIAYSELGRVLQGKQYHSKHVALWSKKITESLLLKVKRLTHNRKKIIATVYIGEKFPGSVEVFVSSPLLNEHDNFQTVSIQINDIFAWVSLITTNA